MKRFTVTTETTLKEFTDAACAQASMCFHTLLKGREIRVNGVKTGADCALHPGDEVCYYLTPAQEAKAAFTVLYEDENVTVADKESGVNSEAVYAALSERGPCYFVHRLDRNTAGLMIFARTAAAYEELLACFRERRVEKIYHALVVGKMPAPHAVLSAYLQKDAAASMVRVMREGRGEKILTEYRVLEERGETSLLAVTLHTGKTHQIRAHLAFEGHPVVGDEKYGDRAVNRRLHATRQRLLSKELSIRARGELSYLCGMRFLSEKNL